MKVHHLNSSPAYEPEKNWKRVSLGQEKKVSVEYFIKPPFHRSPMHQHPQEQILVVVKGKMAVRTKSGQESLLEEGDAAFFESNEVHQVENTLDEPSVGIDIFIPGRSFDFWLKKG